MISYEPNFFLLNLEKIVFATLNFYWAISLFRLDIYFIEFKKLKFPVLTNTFTKHLVSLHILLLLVAQFVSNSGPLTG